MTSSTIFSLLVLLATTFFFAERSIAYNCDTSLIANDPDHEYRDQVYIADCRIEMDEGSLFIVAPGHIAKVTAEQQIRFGHGFHAQIGSQFHAKLRNCIRNPDPLTGFAAWGSDDTWIQDIAKKFREEFSRGYDVQIKLDGEPDTLQFYSDAAPADADDDERNGIDRGVFFFHAGHGAPLGPVVRDSSAANARAMWADMRLGNCSSVDTDNETGELRYLFVCSCRAFAHGPRASDISVDDPTTLAVVENEWEYDRPSDYTRPSPPAPVNTTNDDPLQADAFARLGNVLSDNIRMACGSSTRAHCNVDNSPDSVVEHMRYLIPFYRIADAWGFANARYGKGNTSTRKIIQTPLCIARGNANIEDLRSPITEDWYFTEKANPYDEALHIKSWETSATLTPAWNFNYVDVDMFEDIGSNYDNRQLRFAENTPNFLVKASNQERHAKASSKNIMPVAENTDGNSAYPIFLTKQLLPAWSFSELRAPDNTNYVESESFQRQFNTKDYLHASKLVNIEGRPRVTINSRTGSVYLNGDKKPIRPVNKNAILPIRKYAEIARDFLDSQGWTESDIGDISVVSGMLQVKSLKSSLEKSNPYKALSDITFLIGRRITLEDRQLDVLGIDNEIVVQLNSDGSIKSASKQWRQITSKIDGVPIKSFDQAHREARQKVNDSEIYEMSRWNLAYKSITDNDGQDMMVVYYVFYFEPVANYRQYADTPRLIEIQGHMLESFQEKLAGR